MSERKQPPAGRSGRPRSGEASGAAADAVDGDLTRVNEYIPDPTIHELPHLTRVDTAPGAADGGATEKAEGASADALLEAVDSELDPAPGEATIIDRYPGPVAAPAEPELPDASALLEDPPGRLPLPAPAPGLNSGSSPRTSNRVTFREGPAKASPALEPTGFAVPAQPAADGALVGGRYRLIKRIGEGGMGKVYQVAHAQLGKTFALKIIHQSFAGQERIRDLFYREARLASALSHPNIVSVVDFGEDENYGAFMVMEYLEGRRLSSILRREGRLTVRQACEIMLQVAEALHYMHARKIVHCDIKTENILICELPGSKRRRQVVKLLDFGLARSLATRNTASLSGTPHYVAPERIRGAQAAPPSDIYGLGILFYELLTGRVPWDGTVAEILCGHLEKQPTPPSQLLGDGLDPAVEQLILRALAKTPEQRHKDMAAFLYELHTVMDMLGFGHRHKRGSSRALVVDRSVTRRGSKRDELIRGMFDANRLPMALISATGTIVVANTAFAKFIRGAATDVEGLAVQATPLVDVWTNFETDLSRACSGSQLRRVIEVAGGSGGTWRLLMWLEPAKVDDHAIIGVHPLDA